MTVLSVSEAETLARETLMRCGARAETAASVARALIAAELAGQAGHGLRRVPSYCAQLLSGKIDGQAVASVEARRPGALAIDAAHGFAFPALDLAVERLPTLARKQGIAMAGIRRSHHCGVAGVVVERLAEKGLMALMFANSPPAIAPWGGDKPLFGTNPIAFAAPGGEGGPAVVDISLSKVARGKIMAARQKGTAIPEGWALDKAGCPTTDPEAALGGTMVPMGDAKGTALALMVEMLCAGLTGANFASEASSFLNAEGAPPGTGQLLIAIDPESFGGDAQRRCAAFAELIEAMPGARLPGRRRQALKAAMMRDGIAADAGLLAEIAALGA
ncbi:Ldh family oxidoreductase [Pseudohoeflea coraliihabitans]|uniref:Ldh family oxidoreductase n=1 Tax=Pseudohoeflea coraliihabitans TaxID=2860393 RepID=A0ABS6WLI6_9HYPH|nr:Ldh family oxidoreductase [Pseudohoeflea sp. DP4N28-3]MBW3096635.1 Ldh family oxidoreductase [Pseudohoeflea sp. DP4N28-3]